MSKHWMDNPASRQAHLFKIELKNVRYCQRYTFLFLGKTHHEASTGDVLKRYSARNVREPRIFVFCRFRKLELLIGNVGPIFHAIGLADILVHLRTEQVTTASTQLAALRTSKSLLCVPLHSGSRISSI